MDASRPICLFYYLAIATSTWKSCDLKVPCMHGAHACMHATCNINTNNIASSRMYIAGKKWSAHTCIHVATCHTPRAIITIWSNLIAHTYNTNFGNTCPVTYNTFHDHAIIMLQYILCMHVHTSMHKGVSTFTQSYAFCYKNQEVCMPCVSVSSV